MDYFDSVSSAFFRIFHGFYFPRLSTLALFAVKSPVALLGADVRYIRVQIRPVEEDFRKNEYREHSNR